MKIRIGFNGSFTGLLYSAGNYPFRRVHAGPDVHHSFDSRGIAASLASHTGVMHNNKMKIFNPQLCSNARQGTRMIQIVCTSMALGATTTSSISN